MAHRLVNLQMAKRKKLVGAELDVVEVSPIKIINQAVANCSPLLVLHSVRRGGFIYKVLALFLHRVYQLHYKLVALFCSSLGPRSSTE